MATDQPHLNALTDGVIAASAVGLPIWVYQISVVAGCLTAILGLAVMIVRFLIVMRDWRKL